METHRGRKRLVRLDRDPPDEHPDRGETAQTASKQESWYANTSSSPSSAVKRSTPYDVEALFSYMFQYVPTVPVSASPQTSSRHVTNVPKPGNVTVSYDTRQCAATAASRTATPSAPAATLSAQAAPVGAYVPADRPNFTVTDDACAGVTRAAMVVTAARASRRTLMRFSS